MTDSTIERAAEIIYSWNPAFDMIERKRFPWSDLSEDTKDKHRDKAKVLASLLTAGEERNNALEEAAVAQPQFPDDWMEQHTEYHAGWHVGQAYKRDAIRALKSAPASPAIVERDALRAAIPILLFGSRGEGAFARACNKYLWDFYDALREADPQYQDPFHCPECGSTAHPSGCSAPRANQHLDDALKSFSTKEAV